MWRIRLVFSCFLIFFSLIIVKLFYWQVVVSDGLSLAASRQYNTTTNIPASRGEIISADGFTMATNETAYSLSVFKKELKISTNELADKLAPLFTEPEPDAESTLSGLLKQPSLEEVKSEILKKLGSESDWVVLFHKVSKYLKNSIEKVNVSGLYFTQEQKRFYPEASLSAQLLGFVGKDYLGNDKGYFGLEGFYDRELKGVNGIRSEEKDVYGRPILIGETSIKDAENGRNLILHTDRTIQFLVEERLRQGILKYGAKEGSVVVMNPETGGIIAMASWPSYTNAFWYRYDSSLYRNPVVFDFYEPGSTFKVLVMAAGIEEKVVTQNTKCDRCGGPREISGYTIRTWNNKYFPDTTMTEVLEHSDNTGMVFVEEKLGKKKFLHYLKLFGIGESTGVDVEDENFLPIRPEKEWREIDLATASFGQGIAVTGIQMIRAVSAIANNGILMTPAVVKTVVKENRQKIEIKPKKTRRVISARTSKVLTEMMVQAVDKGEARFAKPEGYRIAGKTGTAQIPVAGHYDEKRTIASFVGFAPADKPKFVMLVRLSEPTSSPWGSETAAPLFFNIARDIFSYWKIPPQ